MKPVLPGLRVHDDFGRTGTLPWKVVCDRAAPGTAIAVLIDNVANVEISNDLSLA